MQTYEYIHFLISVYEMLARILGELTEVKKKEIKTNSKLDYLFPGWVITKNAWNTCRDSGNLTSEEINFSI